MPKNVAAIAAEFQNLHERSEVFVVANPWDRGSARMLAKLGFKALATTSVGVDFADGRKEGSTTLEEMLSHCRMIVDATELPVSGDTESCYAKTPEGVGETIRRLADTGLAGCSIEDVNVYGPGPGRDASIYDLSAAVERVAAAAEAARNLDRPFTLTSRADNFLFGRPDLDDTIKRLQAYQEAGADVLYAPGPRTAEDIRSIVTSLDRPINVLAGMPGMNLSVTELGDLGVRRISIGSNLFRTAFAAAIRGAQEIINDGTFGYAGDAASFKEISDLIDD